MLEVPCRGLQHFAFQWPDMVLLREVAVLQDVCHSGGLMSELCQHSQSVFRNVSVSIHICYVCWESSN